MNQQTHVRIHRFYDLVAFSIFDGAIASSETFYLSEDLARQFARKLYRFARDVKQTAFIESPLSTEIIGEE